MRKTETITIQREGRDKGKVFKITEMPAAQAEKWALRAFFALANTGVELPEGLEESGMAGLAAIGLQALGKVPYEAAEPLLDDLMACVQHIPDPSKPEVVRGLIDEDIEEVATRLELKKSVWELHTGFFSLGGNSTSDPQTSNDA